MSTLILSLRMKSWRCFIPVRTTKNFYTRTPAEVLALKWNLKLKWRPKFLGSVQLRKGAITKKRPQSGLGTMQGSSSTKSHLPPKVVFHHRSSFTKDRLPSKVVFHQKSSSTEGRLPPKVVFHQRSSSTEGRLPLKVVFHWRSSSTIMHHASCRM